MKGGCPCSSVMPMAQAILTGAGGHKAIVRSGARGCLGSHGPRACHTGHILPWESHEPCGSTCNSSAPGKARCRRDRMMASGWTRSKESDRSPWSASWEVHGRFMGCSYAGTVIPSRQLPSSSPMVTSPTEPYPKTIPSPFPYPEVLSPAVRG